MQLHSQHHPLVECQNKFFYVTTGNTWGHVKAITAVVIQERARKKFWGQRVVSSKLRAT